VSRSGYSDDMDDQWQFIRWRGTVKSAIRGKRGQAFLREMLVAMDAMPEKRLVASELEAEGQVCAIGSVGRARGIDMSKLDPEDYDTVAGTLPATKGVTEAMDRLLSDDLVGDIVDGAIARCRNLPDYSGRPAWEVAVEEAIREAVTPRLSSLSLPTPGEGETGLTSHEAIKSLIGMVRTEAASWREPANCDPNNIRTLLDFIAATQEENRRLVKALDERDVLLESAEKQIVSLYRAAAPGGNYDNELTINGHVSGNNFADSDEVVIAIRGSRRATPDHGAAG
jgi:hypothetical protein